MFNRLAGVRHAASERGREADIEAFIDHARSHTTHNQAAPARDHARLLLGNDLHGAMLIGANDHVARGVSLAVDELGWKRGGDYGLIGFDDIRWAREAGVTSVHPPIERMGREAVRLLLTALRGGAGLSADHIRIPSYLIPRASTAPVDRDAPRGAAYE